jgi:glucose/arabinose dehydrogenase
MAWLRKRRGWILVGFIFLLLLAGWLGSRRLREQVNLAGFLGSGSLADLEVPPGFEIELFAEGLDGPRFLAFGPQGILHVVDRGNDRIVALPDEDQDGMADALQVVAEDLDRPHSLIFHEGSWYVGVPSGVVRLEDRDGDGAAEDRTTLIDDYPTSGHFTRTVEFLPDGRMVVSVGSSCNVCEEEDPRRAAIVVYDGPSATGERLFATGLRNAVGLAVHPETGALWASNNGRDLMGDDLPPETVYRVQEGADYGWPHCINGTIPDPDMGFPGACDGVERPLIEMQAHSAPLGIAFYTAEQFPQEYQGDLFIAFHGSWNRSVPTGYKIVRLPLDGGLPLGPVEDFITGWLVEGSGEVLGRPVDVAIGPEGSMFISDDKAGLIYRVRYVGER